MKEAVHISLEETVLRVARVKRDTEGFCLSRYIDAHLREKWKEEFKKKN